MCALSYCMYIINCLCVWERRHGLSSCVNGTSMENGGVSLTI